MKLDRLKKDKDGAVGGKMLLVFVVVLGLLLLYVSGIFSFNLPGVATDEFSERVVRGATDTGIVVPIKIDLTFSQDADTSTQKATAHTYAKHKQTKGSDGNYVPDASTVGIAEFNAKVGNVGDISTIYSTNGNSFQASNVTYNSSVTSLSSTNFGYAQNNYKVWQTTAGSTAYTPGLSKDSHALLIQTVWKHYRKGTNELLSADTVNWIIYLEMPAYNADSDYAVSYTYNIFVPFNDYAVIEDINWDIRGYFDDAVIEWTTVTAVTHEYWDFPQLNDFFPSALGTIMLVRARDTVIALNIDSHWRGPLDFGIDNTAQYGSHAYQYKIR